MLIFSKPILNDYKRLTTDSCDYVCANCNMKFMLIVCLFFQNCLFGQVPDVLNGGIGFSEFNGTWSKTENNLLFPAGRLDQPSAVRLCTQSLLAFPELTTFTLNGYLNTKAQSYGFGIIQTGKSTQSISSLNFTFAQKINAQMNLGFLINYATIPSDSRQLYSLNAGLSYHFQNAYWTLNATYKGLNFGSYTSPSSGSVQIIYSLSKHTEFGLTSLIDQNKIQYQIGLSSQLHRAFEFRCAFAPGKHLLAGGIMHYSNSNYTLLLCWKGPLGIAGQIEYSYEF